MKGKEDLVELAARGYADPIAFCKIFLPRLFPGRIPWVHRGLWAILTRRTDFLEQYGEIEKIISNFVWKGEDGELRSLFYYDDAGVLQIRFKKYVLIKMPRGFSKTTIIVANAIRNICYNLAPFSLYVSEAADHAERQLTTIKYELETNQRLLAVFGSKKPSLNSGLKWNENFFETAPDAAGQGSCAMIARGRGGQIRGLNHKGNRPKFTIVDDVEDTESVKDDKQREKTREWAYRELMPAQSEMDKESGIIAIGTLLHPEALLQTWENDPEWTVVTFGAHDRQGELLWPEMMDEAKLASKKASFVRAQQLHAFYMEYYNEYRVKEGAKFKQSFFIHEPPKDRFLATAIYCDPAISEKRKADDATISVAGIAEGGLIFLLDQWGKRGASPSEILEEFFKLHKLYGCRHAGIESNAFQKALVHIAREWMFRKKHYFEITPVNNRRSADERVELILQPRYAAGYIRHVRVFSKLETQLLDWNPPGHHNDYADSFCGAVQLLDPHANFALAEDDKPDKDEYEPLEAFGGAP